MRPHRVAITAAVTAMVALALAPAGPASAASPDRVDVANAQPSLAGARTLAGSDPAQRITVKLYLKQRNSGDLEALVRTVSDPSSSSYGQYLTPDAFRTRFSPTAATVDSVRSFLTGYGIGVAEVPANRGYVAALGTVAQFQKAFGTSLATVQVAGTKLRAAVSAPSLPTALAGDVVAVSGLASVSSLVKPQHVDGPQVGSRTASTRATGTTTTSAPPPNAFVNGKPCSSYYGEKVATSAPPAFGKAQPYAPCGYVPSQLQGAYGVSSAVAKGVDGRGVRVAITDAYAAPTIASDANTYAKLHGQKPFARGQFTQVLPASFNNGYDDTVNGDTCGEQGWYGEETLDVEAVHAMAPGAHITYVASPSCNNDDLAVTINKVVDEHLADIVTNSWGGTNESNGSPQLDRVYEQIFEQAAAQGIGFYFSSGDSGDDSIDNNGTPTVDAPANSPFVTAVGGTSLAVGRSNTRLWETGWSTGTSSLSNGAWSPTPPGDYLYGGGGGISRVFRQPWYQQGVVPASLSTTFNRHPARVVPDVSAIGDPNTGMLVGETQTFPDGTVKYSEYRIGGTSLASPIFAGIMALADQAAGRPHGFANPILYRAYGSDALYDSKARPGTAVVRVNNSNGIDPSGGTVNILRTIDDEDPAATILRVTPGYDDMTGIGSPNGLAFLAALRH
jgi:subtilase family serine protease